MKRVLVFGVGTGLGGVGNLIMNLYRNINHSQIQFDFIISGKDAYLSDEIYKLGGKIYYVTPKKENVFKNIIDLFSTLYKHRKKYEVVYFNLSALYYNVPFVISKLFRFPIVISHAHTVEPRNVEKNLRYYLHILNRKLVAHTSNYLLSCSNLATKWVFGDSEYINKKSIIVPNGINVGNYTYNEETRLNMRTQLKISEDEFIVGHIGRLSFEKNHLFLIDIFNEIKKIKNNAKLLLVGDGDCKIQIENKIKRLGLEDSVILTGLRSDVPELLNAMDVFVFPSLYEGFGIALVEAQATGLQCFTTRHTVPKEVNITGNVNFMDLNTPPKVWAKKILNIVNTSKRKNFKKVIKSSGYDVVDVAENFEKFIQAILK